MSFDKQTLTITTKTTGFASPAESYVDKRLDLNELIVRDIHSTFYFRYKGPKTLGVNPGDVLVVDRAIQPSDGDLVVLTDKLCFKVREFDKQKNLWGKVSWILKQR